MGEEQQQEEGLGWRRRRGRRSSRRVSAWGHGRTVGGEVESCRRLGEGEWRENGGREGGKG